MLPIVRVRKPQQLCTGHLHFYGREVFGVLCDNAGVPLHTVGAAGVTQGYLALCAADGSALPQETQIDAPTTTLSDRKYIHVDLATYMHIPCNTLVALAHLGYIRERSMYTMATPELQRADCDIVTVHVFGRVTSKDLVKRYGGNLIEAAVVSRQAIVLPPWHPHAGRVVESLQVLDGVLEPGLKSRNEYIQSKAPLETGKYYACVDAAGLPCNILVMDRETTSVYRVREML